MLKKYFLILFLGILAGGLQAQIDSLNPGLAKDCVRSLNFSDRMFQEGNYDISYKYWQYAFNNCDKNIGSAIYYMGEALLAYRLYEVDRGEPRKIILDSLVQLIKERQELYGNELQVKGQQTLSADKKLNALKVFYGINEKCEYIRFGREPNGFTIETFPVLIWDDHYSSIAAALDEDNDDVKLHFIFDFPESFDVHQGDILELQLKNGTKVIMKSDQDVSAISVKKYNEQVYRANVQYSMRLTESSVLRNPDNPIKQIILTAGDKKISKIPEYGAALAKLMDCLK